MKLLILTQYYPPEIGAPQNRLHELALRIKKEGIEVEVLTALPNYPEMKIHDNYLNKKNREEYIDGIKVMRSWIYVSKSSSISKRLLNYFSFVFSSYFRGRKLSSYDFLMVESPPLFLGYSAMRLSKKLNAKMIFNVSDLWPESAEKLNLVTNKRLLKLAYNLEAKCYRKSTLITGQTSGIVVNIKNRFPNKEVYWLPNGCDLNFYNPRSIQHPTFRKNNNFKEDDFLFFYGGILGHAQGLDLLIEAAREITNPKIKIIFQGKGPLEQQLKERVTSHQLTNVIFLEPVAKSEMPNVLFGVDVALVPLKKLPIFEGAIPSKIFEALAMEKALLLGVEGEAKHHFIDLANAGLAFEPENVTDLIEKMNQLFEQRTELKKFGMNGRMYVEQHFNRDKIAADFISMLKLISKK